MSISNQGVVKVFFTQELKVPKDLTKINLNVLYIELELFDEDTEKDMLGFTWRATDFDPNFITIEIKFENPLYISSRSKSSQDTLKVICLDPSYFENELEQKVQLEVESE
jgi:hypothetical protein